MFSKSREEEGRKQGEERRKGEERRVGKEQGGRRGEIKGNKTGKRIGGVNRNKEKIWTEEENKTMGGKEIE